MRRVTDCYLYHDCHQWLICTIGLFWITVFLSSSGAAGFGLVAVAVTPNRCGDVVAGGSRITQKSRITQSLPLHPHYASKTNGKHNTNEENEEEEEEDHDSSMPSKTLLDEVAKVAIEASRKAGELMSQYSEGADVVEKKSTSRDLLTLVDPLCEQAIRETVESAFPDHDFLGEEQVAPGMEAAIAALDEKLTKPSSPWLWIVDPIDGTTNFASGIPLSMPSIAVAYEGHVVVGVLWDPHQNERFVAIRGHGTTMNGDPVRVGDQDILGDAVIGMESPAGQESLEQCIKAIDPLMPLCRTIRMLGSSAVMLPWVANGRLTGYWTPDECAWDIAAGALVVEEAGGTVTDLEGHAYTLRTRSLVATNGKIHNALLEVLQTALEE